MGKDAGAAADKSWEKKLRRLGLDIEYLNAETSPDYDGDERITEIRFKCDADADTSVLVVIKATRGGEKLVAFIGGVDMESALLACVRKMRAGGLKYREDRPWGE